MFSSPKEHPAQEARSRTRDHSTADARAVKQIPNRRGRSPPNADNCLGVKRQNLLSRVSVSMLNGPHKEDEAMGEDPSLQGRSKADIAHLS
jgi:hypothetical protein